MQKPLQLKDEYLALFLAKINEVDTADDRTDPAYFREAIDLASRYATLSELWGEVYKARRHAQNS